MHNLYHSLDLGLLNTIYLFYGDEKLLMEQATERIAKLVAPDEQEWNRDNLDGETCDITDLLERANSSSFFGARKLIVVRNIPWFKAKAAKGEDDAEEETKGSVDVEPLYDYLANPNPTTVLVLQLASAPRKNSRLLKLATEQGRAVEFASPQGGEREQWLRSYFKQAGKQASAEVCQYISLMCGEGLALLKNEADKLILCSSKHEISLEDAEALVSQTSLAVVFSLTDSVAAGDAAAAVETLQRLFIQGEPAQRIMALLANQYRTMLGAKDLARRGFSSSEAASKLGANPYFIKKCLAQSRRYTDAQLIRVLDILLALDRDSKTGRADANDGLTLAIMRICALGNHG